MLPHFLRVRTIAAVAGLVTVLVFAVDAWAGIKYTNDVNIYPAKLRNQKWGVGLCDTGVSKDGFGPLEVGQPDAKRMVVKAVENLPGGAEQVPVETRQEIAKIAEKALRAGETKEGKIGNVEYRVSTYSFTNRPDRNDRRASGLPRGGVEEETMPFIAIRIAEAPSDK
jgi:hypothetical protein